MNGAKAFFDTTVLLYLYGGTDRGKQARAQELFRQHTEYRPPVAEYAGGSGILRGRLSKARYAAA